MSTKGNTRVYTLRKGIDYMKRYGRNTVKQQSSSKHAFVSESREREWGRSCVTCTTSPLIFEDDVERVNDTRTVREVGSVWCRLRDG